MSDYLLGKITRFLSVIRDKPKDIRLMLIAELILTELEDLDTSLLFSMRINSLDLVKYFVNLGADIHSKEVLDYIEDNPSSNISKFLLSLTEKKEPAKKIMKSEIIPDSSLYRLGIHSVPLKMTIIHPTLFSTLLQYIPNLKLTEDNYVTWFSKEGYITYLYKDGVIFIYNVIIDDDLRGKDIFGSLIKYLLKQGYNVGLMYITNKKLREWFVSLNPTNYQLVEYHNGIAYINQL